MVSIEIKDEALGVITRRERYNSLCARLNNLMPPLRTDPQPLGDFSRSSPQPQQLLSSGMKLPPRGRHLDQEALVAEIVIHLPVGVGAGVGPERSTLR